MARIDYQVVLTSINAAVEFARAEKAGLTLAALKTVQTYMRETRSKNASLSDTIRKDTQHPVAGPPFGQ